jgi:hypothetical protein
MSKEKFQYGFQVVVKFRFVGFHYWEDAPPEVEYLKRPHRHEFHVIATKDVNQPDREVEFITLKEQMVKYCRACWEGKEFADSCEHIAFELCKVFNLDQCAVLEDGENGGVCHKIRLIKKETE